LNDSLAPDPRAPNEGAVPNAPAVERALAERFAGSRDERAFRELYRLHTPRIYRIASRLLGDPSGAEDVVQETWIRAAQGLPGFRWEARLSTWLAGIAINRCRETLRERRRGVSPGSETSLGRGPSEGEKIDLERAVNALPNGYREVLVLHDVHGYTHEQIAALLGIEVGTSKSQLSRARRTVRETLRGIVKGDRT
jgi:RNA polymerase sigma-70 factor (ECF subfamily)